MLLQKLLKPTYETGKRDAENSTDLPEFEQVQAASSGFVVADECLRFAQRLRHIDLAKASLHP